MARPLRTTLCLSLLLAGDLVSSAAEGDWETLPNGVLGQHADVQGADGVKIAGYVRKPAGPGPFPIVILLHGAGPTARPVTDQSPDRAEKIAAEVKRAGSQMGHSTHAPIPDFLAQGWAVYTIDYRPIPKYTLDPAEWDDTLAAVNQARAFPFVDPKRMAMLGGSHGGHVTGRMISRVKLSCAVLCAPAGLDLIELSKLSAKGTAIGGNQRLVREFEQRAGVKMAEVEQDPGRYHYTSPLTDVAKIQCPILVVSGRNDPNAPIALMDLFVEKLHALGKEAEVYHPDNGPHGFYFGLPRVIPETAESTRRTVAFIQRQFDAAVK